jgi:tripartite-type tricarboxylate transporter receptor subunit TctC
LAGVRPGPVWPAERRKSTRHARRPERQRTLPFNGAAPAINSTLRNHTPNAFAALPPAIGAIQQGGLRGAAILAKQRIATLPNLATNGEEGVPGLDSDTLTGMVTPAGTPQAIIDKWHTAIAQMLAEPVVKQKLDTLGFVGVGSSPAEFAARIKPEAARRDKVIKAAGIHMD